jgi:hypothetical protein
MDVHSTGLLLRRMAVLAAAAAFALAGGAAFPQEGKRREELARVIDRINDPDPLMRIAALEEILARGNQTEVQLAIKAALNGSDPDLRSVALRGYIAGVRELYLDVSVPQDVEAALAEAPPKDQSAQQARRAIAEMRKATGGRLQVRLDKVDMKAGRFVTYGMNRLSQPDERVRGEGQVVGTQVRMGVGIYRFRRCAVELSPTPALTLEGSATCDNMPRLQLRTNMY